MGDNADLSGAHGAHGDYQPVQPFVVQSVKTLVDEHVVDSDIAGHQIRKPEGQPQRHPELFAAGQGAYDTALPAPIMVNNRNLKRI